MQMEIKARESEQEAKDKGYVPHKTNTHPSHDLKDYLGEYGHPGYGVVSVTADGSGFRLQINKITRSVTHLYYDVFQIPDTPFDDFAKLKVSFFSDANGDISSLSLPLETSVKDIVFTRLPDRQLTDRDFIRAFTGQYEVPGNPTQLTVSLRGDHTLVLSSPGAPDLELLPKRGTAFEVKDENGVIIEFKQDANGKTIEVPSTTTAPWRC